MDNAKFMELFESSAEVGDDSEGARERLRRALEESECYYYDVSGDGTQYYRAGTRNGVGYSKCTVTLREDGLVVVRVVSLPVPEEHRRSMSKLCRSWNVRFKLPGLKVDDGRLVFESVPLDPVSGGLDVDRAVGMAFTTVNQYAPSVLALQAGVEPWALIDLWESGFGGGGGDDDGDGESVPSLEEMRQLLQGLQETPSRQTT